MLSHLSIESFGLIRHLELDIPDGFVTVTGETGAGKSMLLGAVAALLGARVHRELLHESRATRLAGLFHAPEPLEIVREISQGRSRHTVAGQQVSLRELRELARGLADFHGQRDLAQLLERERHAALLDSLPAIRPACAAHDAAWNAWHAAREELARLCRERERQRELRELWQFQLGELERLAARPGEDRELEAAHRVLANAEELKRAGHQAAEALYEGEDSLHGRLAAVEKELSHAARLDPAFTPAEALLREAALQVQEAAQQARARAEALDWDPERLELIRERLQQLDRMIRKHGGTLDALLARQEELGLLLAGGEELDGRIAELEAGEERLRGLLETARGALSAARAAGGAGLSRRLAPLLEELGIAGGRLDVVLEEAPPWDAGGAESPAFFISTNPDTPLGPLEQIASGGELSRVMLALKCLLLEGSAGQCLVFDEIDAGISGQAALAVARLMGRLAERHQLLCITHLPHIAAASRHQIGVEKSFDNGATRIAIRLLDEEGRLRQIAHLQSGSAEAPDLAAAQRLRETVGA